MINTDRLNSLNEDEECLLIYGLQTYYNPLISGDLDKITLASYSDKYLHYILSNEITPKLNESGAAIMSGIMNKLFC